MGLFLNSVAPYENYKAMASARYFVDKTKLLEELICGFGEETQYICITRPRRFGKTIMANMIGAFFGKAVDSSHVFEHLDIAKSNLYSAHLNKHNVIYIDFSELPEKCKSYEQYITRISDGIKADLSDIYPDMKIDQDRSLWDILSQIFETKNKSKFIFVMDEWDAIFYMPFITDDDKKSYLLFLKLLLKSKAYVELAYMTGILPIAKYSEGSELNMFLEYSMATRIRFSEYFGFNDTEVDQLYEQYMTHTLNPRITRASLREWYDGYHTAAGVRLYNPRSIVCALKDNQVTNYWTSSGAYDSIFGYIKDNIADVQDDLALMFAGEAVPAAVQEYAATSMRLKTKDEIYSAMVVYGLLTYEDGFVSIPNQELMDSFAAMMKLKIDHTPEAAIAQIKEKQYALRFKGRLGESPKYKGRILAVGMSYGRETKKHCCKVEVLE